MSTFTIRQITQLVDDRLLSHLNDDAITKAATLVATETDLDPAERDRLASAIHNEVERRKAA